jgi:hypothetical protein
MWVIKCKTCPSISVKNYVYKKTAQNRIEKDWKWHKDNGHKVVVEKL